MPAPAGVQDEIQVFSMGVPGRASGESLRNQVSARPLKLDAVVIVSVCEGRLPEGAGLFVTVEYQSGPTAFAGATPSVTRDGRVAL